MYDEWAGTAWQSIEIRRPEQKVETRAIDSFTDYPGLTEQLLRIQGLVPRPWRPASRNEALGVPAILGAVTLISKTIGSLAMRALRNEVELPPDDRPRVIIRPDPFRIPSEFYSMTGWNIATCGEADWWIARRDGDGNALSVINMPPGEVTITQNDRDLLRPFVEWRGVPIPNDDFRQIVYVRNSPMDLRGVGPLQVCQAAISIAVESQEWAANFFADGAHAPLIIRSEVELADDPDDPDGLTEAERLALEWGAKGNNRPRVVDPRIGTIEQLDEPAQGAQMLDSRQHEVGDIARMFGIPATLLDYAVSGSSLTYQNLESQYDDFLRRCLRPNYLRPIEETMSDLLPRSTVARFDTDALVLADIKTRFDVYNVGIPLGVMSVEEARSKEGLAPGDTDNAPVPFAVPQAIPDQLPIQAPRVAMEVRCDGARANGRRCGKLLAEGGTFIGRCPRCGKEYKGLEVRGPAPDAVDVVRELLDELPDRIAAAIPRSEPSPVIFSEGVFRAETSVPAPIVNVAPPDVRVDAPVVDVEPIRALLEQHSAEVRREIAAANAPRERRLIRDADGRVVGLTEWTEQSA